MKYPEHLEAFMVGLDEAVEKELPDGTATLTITTWQRNLKRVDLDIAESGEEISFNQHIYIHKDTGH
jgi:hypothetical protein